MGILNQNSQNLKLKVHCGYQCFFFYPRKKKLNPRKFSTLCPRSFQTGREKNLKNSPRKKIVPEKKTAKFNPRKKSLCPRKIFKVFPVKIEKIHWNSWISARERKQFIPRKNSKMCPRKLQTAREKLKKKWARKKNPPEKKTKKSTKKRFLGHFSFSRVKKKTLPAIRVKAKPWLESA